MARRESRGAPRERRGKVRAAVGGPAVSVALEKTDLRLDAPQLKVKALALEVEQLELGNLLRIGKVGLAVENLDGVLFLQTQLGDLLNTLNRLIATVNLDPGLFFAPVYNLTVAVTAWSDYLELTQRWFELPIKVSADWTRSELPAIARPATRPSGRFTSRKRKHTLDAEVLSHSEREAV